MPPTTTIPIPPSYPVRVHHYLPSPTPSSPNPTRPVQAYEHLPNNSPSSSSQPETSPKNALIFIGGLGDGPNTIPYVRYLAEHLYTSGAASYAVFEARLSSAFTGYGYSSLAQDAREVRDVVRYLRREVGCEKVVLMGHSTGCQGCLEYGITHGSEEEGRVDGFILQGPVSDREAIGMAEDAKEVKRALEVAEGMIQEGKGGEVVPTDVMPAGWRSSPISAYRWWSLVAAGGDDDYFSSDLSVERLAATFGKLQQPILILPSGEDEWVPSTLDVTAMVDKWKSFCKPGIASDLSGIIPGADHRVENEEGQKWLADRVARFLAEVEKA